MSGSYDVDALRRHIEEDQEILWDEFSKDIRLARNHTWSIGADRTLRRLIKSIRLVGIIPAESVPWILHAGGVYDLVKGLLNLDIEQVTDAQWAEWGVKMSQYGGYRDDLLVTFQYIRAALTRSFEEQTRIGEI